MEITKLITLCNKYSKVERRIERLNRVLKNTEKEIQEAVSKDTGYLVLNGLKWDTENLAVGGTVINGNHYYTFDEAQEAAKSVGKRCPISDDYKELFALGYTWDDENKGYWVAGNHDTDHKGSLFFPAAGYRVGDVGRLNFASSNGYYWSSSPLGSYPERGGNLGFSSSGTVNPQYYSSRAFGFSVRCVSEL